MIPSKALEKIFEKNTQWIDIVKSFGCNRDTSQDIVQEMYFKVQKRLEKGTDIQYSEDDINYYYVFKVLRSLFLDLKRKESKVQIVELGEIENCELDINYEDAYEAVTEEINTLFWYDRKVYEIIDGGKSISELSRQTNISYYSLYNTYKKVKNKLKHLL
jgi:DNA-directed RNA polymerase specialized sigma24 family protein|tara:strand:+ start:29 stop:508 length:480 start_codon:yes stop_codon:yes gene_type:complete